MTNYLYEYDLPSDLVLEGDIAIDCETMGLLHNRDRLCVVQLSNGNGDAHLVHFPKPKYDAPNLKALLSDESRVKIMHFARFDVASVMKYLGVTMHPVFCTKIASRFARTYTDKHGLKELCKELIGKDMSKQQQSSDWGNEELTQKQVQYAASDVLYLHKIRDILKDMLVREGRMDVAKKCFDFIATRAELDLTGWEDRDVFHH